jgi:hypothetical protein
MHLSSHPKSARGPPSLGDLGELYVQTPLRGSPDWDFHLDGGCAFGSQHAAWLVAFLCFIFVLGMKNFIQAEMFAYQQALRARKKPRFFMLRTSRFGRDVVLVLLASAVTVAINSP